MNKKKLTDLKIIDGNGLWDNVEVSKYFYFQINEKTIVKGVTTEKKEKMKACTT